MIHLYFVGAVILVLLLWCSRGLIQSAKVLAWAQSVGRLDASSGDSPPKGVQATPGMPRPLAQRNALLLKWHGAGMLGAGMPAGLLQRSEVPRQHGAGQQANLLATAAVVCTLLGIMLVLLEAPEVLKDKTSLDGLFRTLQPHWVFAPSAVALFLGTLLQARQHQVDDAIEAAWDHVDRLTLETLLPHFTQSQQEASSTARLETCLGKVESALQQLAHLDQAPWAQQMVGAAGVFQQSIAASTASIESAASNLQQAAAVFPQLQSHMQGVSGALSTSMDSIARSGDELQKSLQASQNQLSASTKRLEAFEGASAQVEAQRQQVLEASLVVQRALEGRLGELAQRIDGLASTLHDSRLSDNIDQLHTSLSTYASDLNSAHSAQAQATRELKDQVGAIGTQATTLTQSVSRLLQETGGFADRVAIPLDKVDAQLASTVLGLRELLREQQRAVGETQQQYGHLIEAGGQLQQALRDELQPVGSELPVLSQRFGDLSTLLAAREQGFHNQATRLSELLDGLQRSVTSLERGVEELSHLQRATLAASTAPLAQPARPVDVEPCEAPERCSSFALCRQCRSFALCGQAANQTPGARKTRPPGRLRRTLGWFSGWFLKAPSPPDLAPPNEAKRS